MTWAQRLKRVFNIDIETCPACGGAMFREAGELSPQAVAAVQVQVRRRVLHWFVRCGWLAEEDRQEMQRWAHSGGFSVDAAVRIEGGDRDGLERLVRYCASPPFAQERLEATDTERLVYHLPKPGPDGRMDLTLAPLQPVDRFAALIPPPSLQRHHGVWAPTAPLPPGWPVAGCIARKGAVLRRP